MPRRRRAGATLDDFDALCAHLATMHPSRYLALIEGVAEVFITGVHPLDDQNVALRLVSLTDRLYDAGIPVVASGTKLDTIFSEEMLAGGFRKKYLRATSRSARAHPRGSDRAHHHVVVLDAVAQPERLGAADHQAVLGVEALGAFVFLVDPEPHARGAESSCRVECRGHQRGRHACAVPSGRTYIFDNSTAGRSGTARWTSASSTTPRISMA